MRARTLLAVAGLSFATLVVWPGLVVAHAGDCSRSGTPTFTWENPIGVDYYTLVENTLNNRPEGDVRVTVRENCTIQGFSTLANEGDCFPLAGPCCPGNENPCIKFYATFRTVNNANFRDTWENFICSVFITGQSGVTNMFVTRAFGSAQDPRSFQCEGYCKQGFGDCILGRSVTSHILLGHHYEWETPDAIGTIGASSTTNYQARSRDVSNVAAVTSPNQLHRTCQYGDPLVLQPVIALASGVC